MNNKFFRMGTHHSTYVKRFVKNFTNSNSFYINTIDNYNHVILNENDIKVDKFSSNTKISQFIKVCIALGFIRSCPAGYKIINKEIDFKKMTDAIFQESDNNKIIHYRDSRKYCFLWKINLFNEVEAKKKGITKIKGGLLTNKDLKDECSLWEKLATNSIENILYVLERIKNEYKI